MKKRSKFETKTGNNLLFYSLADFQSVIHPILEKFNPKSICEIGVEKGRFTRFLFQFCGERECSFTGIDPTLEERDTELFKGENINFRKGFSLSLLKDLLPHEIYFIDGDHNYYTVKNELQQIFQKREKQAILFLHNVPTIISHPEKLTVSPRSPLK